MGFRDEVRGFGVEDSGGGVQHLSAPGRVGAVVAPVLQFRAIESSVLIVRVEG